MSVERGKGHVSFFDEESGQFLCARCNKPHPAPHVVQIVPDDDYYTFWLCRFCCRQLGELPPLNVPP